MARLSPGRVFIVNAVPTKRPERWNGLSPTEPASRARLSEMMEVGATLNASISAAGGLATEVAAMLMIMPINPPCRRALAARAVLDGQDCTGRDALPIAFPLISHNRTG